MLYEYQPDRRKERPRVFLDGFSGYLHTDGYAGYHALPGNIRIVGCFAHARRKFDDALKLLPEKERANCLAQRGLQYIKRLYAIEEEIAALSIEERYTQRQERARPVLEAFLAWLKTLNVGKSVLGRAVKYTQDQWAYLIRYLEDGSLEIDNNRAERSIKPFVIGRKNFLFANAPDGAKGSAVIYTMIQTAMENGLNPYTYLAYVFKNAPNWDLVNDPEKLELLMPWRTLKACENGVDPS